MFWSRVPNLSHSLTIGCGNKQEGFSVESGDEDTKLVATTKSNWRLPPPTREKRLCVVVSAKCGSGVTKGNTNPIIWIALIYTILGDG